MRSGRSLVGLVMMAGLSVPLHADQGKTVFSNGVKAEQKGDYDTAFNCYKQAYTMVPKNIRYFAAYVRIRFTAATQHVHTGELLRNSGALTEALAQFQRAVDIDNTNIEAKQEVQRTNDMISRHERA